MGDEGSDLNPNAEEWKPSFETAAPPAWGLDAGATEYVPGGEGDGPGAYHADALYSTYYSELPAASFGGAPGDGEYATAEAPWTHSSGGEGDGSNLDDINDAIELAEFESFLESQGRLG